MSFHIIQELTDDGWVQCDLAHYTRGQAERSMEIYRLCRPDGNSMRIMHVQVVNIHPADKEQ